MKWKKYNIYFLSIVLFFSFFIVKNVEAYNLYTGSTLLHPYTVSNLVPNFINGFSVMGTTTAGLVEGTYNSGDFCQYTLNTGTAGAWAIYADSYIDTACGGIAMTGTYYIYFFGNYLGSNNWNTIQGYDVFFNGSNTNIPTSITSFTYSTTTRMARVQGYWNATSTTGITERLEFYQFSTLLGIESFNEVIATTTGNFDLSFEYLSLPTPYTGTTTAPFVADTTLFAKIYQYDNNYGTDPFSGVFDSRYKTLLVSTSTTILTLTGINISISIRALFSYPEYECSITSLTGCFKNALIWAFYPTQDGIEQYYNFITLIENKAPIGYFFVVRDGIQGLNKDGTPNTNIIIPHSLKTYIFNPFDIGIGGILWIFFLFNFYKRLKHITI